MHYDTGSSSTAKRQRVNQIVRSRRRCVLPAGRVRIITVRVLLPDRAIESTDRMLDAAVSRHLSADPGLFRFRSSDVGCPSTPLNL